MSLKWCRHPRGAAASATRSASDCAGAGADRHQARLAAQRPFRSPVGPRPRGPRRNTGRLPQTLKPWCRRQSATTSAPLPATQVRGGPPTTFSLEPRPSNGRCTSFTCCRTLMPQKAPQLYEPKCFGHARQFKPKGFQHAYTTKAPTHGWKIKQRFVGNLCLRLDARPYFRG